jgi:hypothetical protein
MKRKILLFIAVILLSSCEYLVDGQIKNSTNDTLYVTIVADTDLSKESNKDNWWDEKIYESAFRDSSFIDTKTTWLPNKIFKADFKINPNKSVQIMGGLGPASEGKIHFDTLTIKNSNGQILSISGKKNIFKSFQTDDNELYILDIK